MHFGTTTRSVGGPRCRCTSTGCANSWARAVRPPRSSRCRAATGSTSTRPSSTRSTSRIASRGLRTRYAKATRWVLAARSRTRCAVGLNHSASSPNIRCFWPRAAACARFASRRRKTCARPGSSSAAMLTPSSGSHGLQMRNHSASVAGLSACWLCTATVVRPRRFAAIRTSAGFLTTNWAYRPLRRCAASKRRSCYTTSGSCSPIEPPRCDRRTTCRR